MLKVLTTVAVLASTGFAATSVQADHRYNERETFLSAAKHFEYAAKRMRRAVHYHGGHVYIEQKVNRVTRAARGLRRGVERVVPARHLRYRLKAVALEFRDLRRAYRHNFHLKQDRRVARSFRVLSHAHKRLHRISRSGGPRPRGNVLHFSMSF